MKTLKEYIQDYNSLGYCVVHFPRKKQVCINGFKYLSESEALKFFKEFFSNKQSK